MATTNELIDKAQRSAHAAVILTGLGFVFSLMGLVMRCNDSQRPAAPLAAEQAVEAAAPVPAPTGREVAPVRLNRDPRDSRLTCPPGARAVWTVSVWGAAPPPPRCYVEPAP